MRRNGLFAAVVVLLLGVLACSSEQAQPTGGAPGASQPDSQELPVPAFGFFPTPPEATIESVLGHFADLGKHADFILIQPEIPWEDFAAAEAPESQRVTDLRNQVSLAKQHGMGWIFILDPLNGLNRREFMGLPPGWQADFGNPEVRSAFRNFALWIVDEFNPSYLGLASEINTYLDAHPADLPNYLSLYNEVYGLVKERAPQTQVFVTFQWDDLNNMLEGATEGRARGETNWDQIEQFEPRLDLWAISSYPYFVFNDGHSIPETYYSRLLERTEKRLAVAEGGYSSRSVGWMTIDDGGQAAYLQAINDQLGPRLDFWVNLILNDLNMDSIGAAMVAAGRPASDAEGLALFASLGLRQSDGTPKPALEVWDHFRETRLKE